MLCEVFDLQSSKVLTQILPTPGGPLKNAHAAMQFVVLQAKQNDQEAINALAVVMKSIQTAKPLKPRKKK